MKKIYILLSLLLFSLIVNAIDINGPGIKNTPAIYPTFEKQYSTSLRSSTWNFKWDVIGGKIIRGKNEDTVIIRWYDSNVDGHKVKFNAKAKNTPKKINLSEPVKVLSLKGVKPAKFTNGDKNIPFGDNRGVTYTIPRLNYPAVPGFGAEYANSYDWIIPPGWIHNKKPSNGTDHIKTYGPSITVYPDDCTGGKVEVFGVSFYSSMSKSDGREREITRSNKSSIKSSQSTTVCGKPKEITVSVVSILGASYQWTKPASWKWTSATNSNIVKVMPDGLSGGVISVNVKGCTNFTESKTITLLDWDPNEKPEIKGAYHLCPGGGNYSLLNAYSNATSIKWTSSSNITITSGKTGTNVSISPYSSTSIGGAWIKATLTNINGKSISFSKGVSITKIPTISFDNTSLKDAIIAGANPDNYPDLPLISDDRIPVDIQHSEEIAWKNTREKMYIPKDKPGTHTHYDPASLIRYVPYFTCLSIGDRFTDTESISPLTQSIDYYFIEDFYRNPPTPEERPKLPNGLEYPIPDYEIQSEYVLGHHSPKIYFAAKGLIEVEVTASNQCGCTTETNIYNTPKQIKTSTSTPEPKESPYSLAMFPNPADNNVFISVVESVKSSDELTVEDPGRIIRPDLGDEFYPKHPIVDIGRQEEYTIQVYNALTGAKIEQRYIYAGPLSSLVNRIKFTSLNTANYQNGIYLIKVISETENTLITGKLSVKH
jgi:hypothetical protein